jgi:predicted metal-dependent RNase
MTIKQYVAVKDMTKLYPIFTVGALRHLIHENKNGIHECLKRVGRRIYFDTAKFEQWMDKQNMEAK